MDTKVHVIVSCHEKALGKSPNTISFQKLISTLCHSDIMHDKMYICILNNLLNPCNCTTTK